MKVLEDYIIFLIWGFSLVSIFSKNKHFQSGTLLETPPSFPSMEEFGLNIQKQISLKKQRFIFPINNKNTLKN